MASMGSGGHPKITLPPRITEDSLVKVENEEWPLTKPEAILGRSSRKCLRPPGASTTINRKTPSVYYRTGRDPHNYLFKCNHDDQEGKIHYGTIPGGFPEIDHNWQYGREINREDTLRYYSGRIPRHCSQLETRPRDQRVISLTVLLRRGSPPSIKIGNLTTRCTGKLP